MFTAWPLVPHSLHAITPSIPQLYITPGRSLHLVNENPSRLRGPNWVAQLVWSTRFDASCAEAWQAPRLRGASRDAVKRGQLLGAPPVKPDRPGKLLAQSRPSAMTVSSTRTPRSSSRASPNVHISCPTKQIRIPPRSTCTHDSHGGEKGSVKKAPKFPPHSHTQRTPTAGCVAVTHRRRCSTRVQNDSVPNRRCRGDP